jgi:OOP family OmpA-OmpF porin
LYRIKLPITKLPKYEKNNHSICNISYYSCLNKKKEHKSLEISKNQPAQPTHDAESENRFDIERIPYSTADLGNIPFFTLPKGLKEMNKPLKKSFDICFFPINGKMTSFEGQLYKAISLQIRDKNFLSITFKKL